MRPPPGYEGQAPPPEGIGHPATPRGDSKVMVPDEALRFPRPTLSAGGKTFKWPVGPEGFEVNGTAQVGLHRYIGDNVADAHVIHFDERRIMMTGTFPGIKSPTNMVNLTDVLTSRSKKILNMPGVFSKQQYVVVESYNFTHSQDDRTQSIDYSITLIRVGIGGAAGSGGSGGGSGESSTAKYISEQAQEIVASTPSVEQRNTVAMSQRTYMVADGVDTFRAIAGVVYGNVDHWPTLMDLNTDKIPINNPGMTVTRFGMAYHRWPAGTLIVY